MIDTIQAAALVTLAVGALAFLRGKWRRRTTYAAVLAALALLVAMPQPASAAEIHKGATYDLPVGEEVHDDLIVTGNVIHIDGTVDGDVIAVGGTIMVNGHVTGDVIAFAQSLRVGGIVDGNIRGFVNTLTLDGSVAKNVSIFAQTSELNSGSKIGGTLTAFTQECVLDGKLGGSMLAFDGRTDLEGTVGGGVQLYGDQLSLASRAEVDGPIRFTGQQPPDVAQGARLASPVQFVKNEHQGRRHEAMGRELVGDILRYGAAVLIALLLMSILPGLYVDGVRAARRFGFSMGVGSLSLLVFMVLIVAGIGLLIAGVGGGLAMAMAYVPMMYLAQIFVGGWLGDVILGEKAGIGAQLGHVALGLLIIHGVEMVPFLGVLASGVVLAWGSGALLMAIYLRSRTVAAAPAAA